MMTPSTPVLIHEEEVTFRSGRVTLAGTLLLPAAPRPCPAVALIHGSGDDTRDDYRVFAQHFAAHGVATLIYDKRGVGSSTGSWRTGTFAELAEDALAGVRLLARREEIDARRVGLWGCSEGGWVAPLAASRSPEARFLVVVSAAGMSPAMQETYRRTLLVEAGNPSWMRRAWRMAGMRLMFGTLRHAPRRRLPGVAGYFARTMDYDPLPTWRTVTQPTLLIYGAEDKAVPPQQSAEMIASALQHAGNHDFTIQTFPGADHGVRCYDAATQKRMFAPGYLDAVAHWIAARQ
jgi:dipeptidyl aminopeptidase/acylaminoacyl peptidase